MMFKNRLIKQCTKIVLLISFLVILYNEYLVYSIQRLRWNNITCKNANCTRILFVADPQILGETFELSKFQWVTIFDSDRYVSQSFSRALAHSDPHVICYMGDLMDEGSVASASQYIRYLDRFREIFKTGPNVELMHIPGDNDIGGERTDLVTEFKTNRFKQAFGERGFLDIKNKYRLLNVNLLTHQYPDVREVDGEEFEAPINIVLTHISLLSYPGFFTDTITTKFKPKVIFSAHLHISSIITYPPMRSENINDDSVFTFNLMGIDKTHNGKQLREIMIPTCSYRMGVKRIGFGMAVLDGNELHYTVLWLPDRFLCIWIYLGWFGFLLTSMIIWLIAKRRAFCRRRTTYHHRHLITNHDF